jgi:hypothetical protein
MNIELKYFLKQSINWWDIKTWVLGKISQIRLLQPLCSCLLRVVPGAAGHFLAELGSLEQGRASR